MTDGYSDKEKIAYAETEIPRLQEVAKNAAVGLDAALVREDWLRKQNDQLLLQVNDLMQRLASAQEVLVAAGVRPDVAKLVLNTPALAKITTEYAVQTKTFLDGDFDRTDDGRGWSDRRGKPYTLEEAEEVASKFVRYVSTRFPDNEETTRTARVVTRTVSEWKEVK